MFARVLLLLTTVPCITCSLNVMCSSINHDKQQNCYIIQEGNIMVIVFLPLCFHDNNLNIAEKFPYTQLMNYITNEINVEIREKKNTLNITFGYKIHDTCRKSYEEVAEMFISYVLPQKYENNQYIVGFTGDLKIEILEFAINVFLPYQYPIVTVSLQAPKPSRKSKGIYTRMPDIDLKAETLIKVFHRFEWKYTAIIVSNDPYGNEGKSFIIKELEKSKQACISFIKYFDETDETLQAAIKSNAQLKVVFVWMELDNYLKFFKYVSDHRVRNVTWMVNHFPMVIPHHFWLSLDPWSVHGTILLSGFSSKKLQKITGYDSFPLYLENQTSQTQATNSFQPYDIAIANNLMTTLRTFEDFISQTFKSDNFTTFEEFSLSLHKQSIKKKNMLTYLWPFIYISQGKSYILDITNQTTTLRQLTYKFRIRLWEYFKVNEYPDFPIWAGYNEEPPDGKCDSICSEGHFPIFINGKQCCWTCYACREGYIKNDTGNTACKQCPYDTLSNLQKTNCRSFTNVYLSYTSKTAYIVYAILAFSELITLSFAIIIVRYKNTPVVRLSNFPVSMLQLIAHFILSAIPLVHIGEPLKWKCFIEPLLTSTLFTIVVGVLFAKTNYLVEIFKSKGRERGRKVQMRKYKQYFQIGFFVITNASIFIVHVIKNPVTISNYKYAETMNSQLSCANIQHTNVQTIVIASLLFGCAFQAFRARNLPGSFNEAHALMYSTFIVSVAFFISPLIYNGATLMEENTLARTLVNFCGNIVLLIFTFGGRCYILLFRSDLNTEARVRQSTLNAMKKKVDHRMSARSENSQKNSTIT